MELEEIIKADQENVKMLNNFLSNIIKNLGIPQYNEADPICQNLKPSLTLSCIML